MVAKCIDARQRDFVDQISMTEMSQVIEELGITSSVPHELHSKHPNGGHRFLQSVSCLPSADPEIALSFLLRIVISSLYLVVISFFFSSTVMGSWVELASSS
jgi:hypothetical protein